MVKTRPKGIFKENGLSIVLLIIIIVTIAGHLISGHITFNDMLNEYGRPEITIFQYMTSGHFLGTFFENWESEFLQMGLYVLLTVFLFQKGSSESKSLDKEEPVDREPNPKKKDAPLPVKKGGIWLSLYKNSLSYAFLILFIASIFLHGVHGARDYNQEQELKGKPERVTTMEFMGKAEFWYQSFQNWQSEFVAVFSIVVLSIFLRQKGSPESKPVDASHSESGE